MKKTKLTIGFLATLLVITISCKRDFLNTKPLDQISSDVTWSDGALSEAFVFGVYASFGYGGSSTEDPITVEIKDGRRVASGAMLKTGFDPSKAFLFDAGNGKRLR